MQGPGVYTVVTQVIVQGSAPPSGIFLYNTLNQLVASMTVVSGPAPLGGTAQAGITSYPGTGGTYAQMNAGVINLVNPAEASANQIAEINSGLLGLTSARINVGDIASRISVGSAQSASPGLTVLDGADGNSYDTERLTASSSANQTISSTVDVLVTGLTTPVGARKYRIICWIPVSGVSGAGVATIHLTGPAIASGNLGSELITSSVAPALLFGPGLPTPSFTMSGVAPVFIRFEGVVTFSAAGTLSAQARTSAAVDTYIIGAGAYLEILPVV